MKVKSVFKRRITGRKITTREYESYVGKGHLKAYIQLDIEKSETLDSTAPWICFEVSIPVERGGYILHDIDMASSLQGYGQFEKYKRMAQLEPLWKELEADYDAACRECYLRAADFIKTLRSIFDEVGIKDKAAFDKACRLSAESVSEQLAKLSEAAAPNTD